MRLQGGPRAAWAFSLLILPSFAGCAWEGEALPMAGEEKPERPTWRDNVGEIEAILATDRLLLRFSHDSKGRIVGVLGIEGPFDRQPAGRMPRDFFSMKGIRGDGESDFSPWPSGGRVAWCHSFAYDQAGNLRNEIDCLSCVSAFKAGSDAKIDPERGTALRDHLHRGETRGGSIPASDGREFVDRLRVDLGAKPLFIDVGSRTTTIDVGGGRVPTRK